MFYSTYRYTDRKSVPETMNNLPRFREKCYFPWYENLPWTNCINKTRFMNTGSWFKICSRTLTTISWTLFTIKWILFTISWTCSLFHEQSTRKHENVFMKTRTDFVRADCGRVLQVKSLLTVQYKVYHFLM